MKYTLFSDLSVHFYSFSVMDDRNGLYVLSLDYIFLFWGVIFDLVKVLMGRRELVMSACVEIDEKLQFSSCSLLVGRAWHLLGVMTGAK